MTREEAIKILSILKAAYPNSYKGMTKDEANGTINIWTSQFAKMPYFIVAIAINKLIGTNAFPPSIKEVKEKITGLHWEAYGLLNDYYQYKQLEPADEKKIETLKEIIKHTESYRIKRCVETPLSDILNVYDVELLTEGEHYEKLGQD